MNEFIVREARPEDAAQIIAHIREMADEPDNGIAYSSSSEVTWTEEKYAQNIRDYAEAENRLLLVAESTADGKIIALLNCGGGGLGYKHTVSLTVTVNKAWRDRGVGTAIIQHTIDWCRANPIIHRLELYVFPNNPRANHVYEKLGFEYEGNHRQAYFKQGEFLDLIIMGMLFQR